jgi:hypothetical protein
MPDYLLLMHHDAAAADGWDAYIASMRADGHFQGGSAMGGGLCVRKSGPAPAMTSHLSGFIRIRADSLDHARALLAGNPAYEQGGTVEIRELPVSA